MQEKEREKKCKCALIYKCLLICSPAFCIHTKTNHILYVQLIKTKINVEVEQSRETLLSFAFLYPEFESSIQDYLNKGCRTKTSVNDLQ
jgi:hypothetical protein